MKLEIDDALVAVPLEKAAAILKLLAEARDPDAVSPAAYAALEFVEEALCAFESACKQQQAA